MPDHRTHYYVMDNDYNIVRAFSHSSIGKLFAALPGVLNESQRGDTFLLVSTKGKFTRSKPLYVHARIERLEQPW